MKLSEYAKQQGISYRTAFRWWQAGQIPGYQAATGTIIVQEPKATVLLEILYSMGSNGCHAAIFLHLGAKRVTVVCAPCRDNHIRRQSIASAFLPRVSAGAGEKAGKR